MVSCYFFNKKVPQSEGDGLINVSETTDQRNNKLHSLNYCIEIPQVWKTITLGICDYYDFYLVIRQNLINLTRSLLEFCFFLSWTPEITMKNYTHMPFLFLASLLCCYLVTTSFRLFCNLWTVAHQTLCP